MYDSINLSNLSIHPEDVRRLELTEKEVKAFE